MGKWEISAATCPQQVIVSDRHTDMEPLANRFKDSGKTSQHSVLCKFSAVHQVYIITAQIGHAFLFSQITLLIILTVLFCK